MQPDLACFAKAIGGGTPGAAFGGRADVMEAIERGAAQQGTFNGNPLVAAAGLADAHRGARRPTRTSTSPSSARAWPTAARRRWPRHGIPGHTVDLGAKGCVSYRPEPLRNYRDFLETEHQTLRGVVPVDGEPRRVHDARATRSSGRSRCSTPRPTSTATSTAFADLCRGAGEGVKRRDPGRTRRRRQGDRRAAAGRTAACRTRASRPSSAFRRRRCASGCNASSRATSSRSSASPTRSGSGSGARRWSA